MANVTLLRQSLEDYNKKFDAANTAYLAGYGAYQTQFDAYKTATDNYNAQVEAFNAAGATAGSIFQNEQGTLSQYDIDGNVQAFKPSTGGQYDMNTGGYVDGSGNNVTAGDAYKAADGTWVYDVTTTTAPGTSTVSTVPISVSAYHPGTAPVAPTAPSDPELIRKPNLTVSDLKELQNPGLDQAGMQMAMNNGLLGKSELAGMEQSKNSAFADPEDPNNLKDVGVLARVMGGQL